MGKRILLVGAGGLVGQGVLKVLHSAPEVAQVIALLRHPLAPVDGKTGVLQVADYSEGSLAEVDLEGLDACLYCAGPLPVGMSEAAYREATVGVLERVVHAYARANPAGYVIYVSGAGANPSSRLMPLRVKGQAESADRQSRRCVMPASLTPACARAWCARCSARSRRMVCAAGCIPLGIHCWHWRPWRCPRSSPPRGISASACCDGSWQVHAHPR